jgi:uncharacterized protein
MKEIYPIKRIIKEPTPSYVLYGAQGTGKSTFVIHQHPTAVIIDLRIDAERYRFLNNPSLLTDLIAEKFEKKLIVICEVQKIPELVVLIKTHSENRKDLKFILTSSNPQFLKDSQHDLATLSKAMLLPFMAIELQSLFLIRTCAT